MPSAALAHAARCAPALTAVTPERPARVTAAGALAHAALAHSYGITQPVPGFESTPFRLAAGTLIWAGVSAPLHPRTVLLDSASFDRPFQIDSSTQFPSWHYPETLGAQGLHRDGAARTAARALLRTMALTRPAGLGLLFTPAALPFPLSHRAGAAHGLAHACAANDAALFGQCAQRLLGVGAGLTPSGDDFVGGALFARRWLRADAAWQGVAEDIIAQARHRTHVISAALLADLANGQSYAALHGFADALARLDDDGAYRHAAALVAIGSSSGWDMLAGFIAALRGTLDLS